MQAQDRENTIEQGKELEYLRATTRIRLSFFHGFSVETYPANLKYRLLETARQIKALTKDWRDGRKSKLED